MMVFPMCNHRASRSSMGSNRQGVDVVPDLEVAQVAAAFQRDTPQEPVQFVEGGVAPDAQLQPVGTFPGPDRQACRLPGSPPPVPPARVWGWFEAGPRLDAIEQMPANPVAGHRLLADEAGPRDCGAHGHGSSPDDGALGTSPTRVSSSPRSAIPLIQLSVPGAARPRAGRCTPPWATGSSRSRPRSGGLRSNAPPARPRSCRYTGSTPTRPFPKSLPPPLRPDGSGFSSAAGCCQKRFTP